MATRICNVFRQRRWWFGGIWRATVICKENGEPVSQLCESYKNRADCVDAACNYLKFDEMIVEGKTS